MLISASHQPNLKRQTGTMSRNSHVRVLHAHMPQQDCCITQLEQANAQTPCKESAESPLKHGNAFHWQQATLQAGSTCTALIKAAHHVGHTHKQHGCAAAVKTADGWKLRLRLAHAAMRSQQFQDQRQTQSSKDDFDNMSSNSSVRRLRWLKFQAAVT